jgi:hypothetical protein
MSRKARGIRQAILNLVGALHRLQRYFTLTGSSDGREDHKRLDMTGDLFLPSRSGLEILCRLDTLACDFFYHLDHRLNASLIYLSINDSLENDRICHNLCDIRASAQDRDYLLALQETAAATVEMNRSADEDSLGIELEKAFEAFTPGWSFFVGKPSRYHNNGGASSVNCCYSVLRLPASPYLALKRSVSDSSLHWRVIRSYMDALILKLLDLVHLHISMKLYTDDNRLATVDEKSLIAHICREAARNFLSTLGVVKNGKLLPELFDTVCSLAAATYEGMINRGRLVITNDMHNLRKSERLVEFVEPVRLSQTVAARKILEMSSPDHPAISDGEYILGICTGLFEKHSSRTILIDFMNHKGWRLTMPAADESDDTKPYELLLVKDGNPHLYDPHPDMHRLYKVFQNIFGSSGDILSESELHLLVSEAKAQKRGTMLLISEAAQEEAHRLRDQATVIAPRQLVKGVACPILSLTAIDGTIVLTPDGTCHAIGAILDGSASAGRGDSSRGARYNNALRYVAASPHRCMAIVFSVDGEIDVFPGL